MAFDNFRVVPPGTGICHQVNLEYLAQVVLTSRRNGKETIAYPDTLVGTDSHTTMVNGLAVLGWGVGGIEAEAAMLGQPQPMVIPEVVGFKLTGKLREGATATDLVLTVTQMLRKKGVVNKFVEFYGDGLERPAARQPRHHRQHGAGIRRDLRLLPDRRDHARLPQDHQPRPRPPSSSRPMPRSRACGAPRSRPSRSSPTRCRSTSATSCRAWPAPSARRTACRSTQAAQQFVANMEKEFDRKDDGKRIACEGTDYDLGHGDVVIAAITSCTNTSNPYVMLGAGLIARNAVKHGLKVKPWVKTSLAPGSQVVTEYLEASGLQKDLNKIGYNLVGYGCTTLHRQFGPAARSGDQGDRRRRPRGLRRCCRATATSRAASIR